MGAFEDWESQKHCDTIRSFVEHHEIVLSEHESAGFTQTCGVHAAQVHADTQAKKGQTKYWNILKFIDIYQRFNFQQTLLKKLL